MIIFAVLIGLPAFIQLTGAFDTKELSDYQRRKQLCDDKKTDCLIVMSVHEDGSRGSRTVTGLDLTIDTLDDLLDSPSMQYREIEEIKHKTFALPEGREFLDGKKPLKSFGLRPGDAVEFGHTTPPFFTKEAERKQLEEEKKKRAKNA